MAHVKIKEMDLLGTLDVEQDRDTTESLIPVPTAVGQGNFEEMDELKHQVNLLENSVSELVRHIHETRELDRKPLIKPRDIPVLELRHLRGDEGDGRLGVFFSQIEECSQNTEERKRIVLSRVDSQLAVYIQDMLTNGPSLTWWEFKSYLRRELTDPNPNRLFDALNELKYSYKQDPVEFMNQLKCKYSLLSLKTDPREAPKKEKLIKNKLIKGMPKDCRERLELFMDDNVSLGRFLDKLEVERVVANTRSKEEVFLIQNSPTNIRETPQTPPTNCATPPLDTRLDRLEDRMRQLDRLQRQKQTWGENKIYCPYCRSNNHNISTCKRKPTPGSCFDCLRMNCRRGSPNCPGRNVWTR